MSTINLSKEVVSTSPITTSIFAFVSDETGILKQFVVTENASVHTLVEYARIFISEGKNGYFEWNDDDAMIIFGPNHISLVLEDMEPIDLFGLHGELQNSDETQPFNYSKVIESFTVVTDQMTNMIKKLNMDKIASDYTISLIEDILLLCDSLGSAKNIKDYTKAIISFIKMRTNQSITKHIKDLVSYFMSIFSPCLQNNDNPFSIFRVIFREWDKFKDTQICSKIRQFIVGILSFSLLEKYGIDFKSMGYSYLEEQALRRQNGNKLGFMWVVFDSITFICEQGYTIYKTGSLSCVYHSGKRPQLWAEQVEVLVHQSKTLSSPITTDKVKFQFLRDLDKSILEGRELVKSARVSNERKTLILTLNRILSVKERLDIDKVMSGMRKAPFSTLIIGSSSIGKSMFSEIVKVHFAKYFGLNTSEEFFYTLSPTDQFMSGFRSNVHTVSIDDIAYMNPNSAQGMDATIAAVIQLQNNIPYCTPQAELENKGKIPFLAQHLVATGNTENLNAHHYFSCTLAPRRRFPLILSLKLKKQYTKDMNFLDSSKVPTNDDGSYHDLWEIEVKKVVPAGTTGKLVNDAKVQSVHTFTDINDFLSYYMTEAENHRANQQVILKSCSKIRETELCGGCKRNLPACVCSTSDIDSGSDSDDSDGPHDWDNYENPELRAVLRTTLDGEEVQDFVLQNTEENRLIVYEADVLREMRETKVPEEKETWYEWFFDETPLHTFANSVSFWTFAYVAFWYVVLRIGPYIPLFAWLCEYFFGQQCFYHWTAKHLIKYGYGPVIMKRLTKRFKERHITPQRLKTIGLISAICASSFCVYKAINYVRKWHRNHAKDELQLDAGSILKNIKFGSRPEGEHNERENVWFNDKFELTRADVSKTSQSLNNLTPNEFGSYLGRNIVSLCYRFRDDDLPRKRMIRGLCIKGNIYVFNTHALPKVDVFEVEFIHAPSRVGISSNISIMLNRNSFKHIEGKDLSFIEIRSVPPKKDITEFIVTTTGGVFNGCYAQRNTDTIDFIELERVQLTKNIFVEPLNSTLDVATAIASPSTKNGDCGSVMIIKTAFGPQIAGIHTLGDGNRASCPLWKKDMINTFIMENFNKQFESNTPDLGKGQFQHVLGDLHRKSTFRYIDQGTADVMGSFSGWKAAPKTKVGPTFIQQNMLKRGYTLTHDKPVMSGWEPWRIGAKEYLQPNNKFDPEKIAHCASSFLEDIKTNLPVEEWKQIQVYDLATTVNGIAGLQYVDKMNRATSMGFPWRKPKTHFLTKVEPTVDAPDAVEFAPEILERVDNIISGYLAGKRACIVFVHTLKDEPKSFKKIALKETRVFMCGSTDLAIVARSHFLSIVRVMQRNKTVFESALGAVCQSTEWGDLRSYVTKFGEKQIVAGDYKFYDKKMSPQVIMAAFDILIGIAKYAGYSDESLTIMRGVAIDTSYPLGDFNGDLVQWYGGHASGETLTSVINSLVNGIYYRYTFILVTQKNASLFRSYCAFMYYGDDSIGSISPAISDIYNHTSIADAFKKIGITYTMAEKDAASVPLIDIRDTNFLKRSWRWDEDMKEYLCPLEHDSINKMLTVTVASTSVTPQEQSMSIIASAIREYFFYGKKIFLEKRKMFEEVIEEAKLSNYMEEWVLPTYEELCDTFYSHTKKRM